MTRISAGAATIATTGGRINVISGKERRAGSFPARSSSVKIKVDEIRRQCCGAPAPEAYRTVRLE